MNDMFWNASLEQLKCGYTQDDNNYLCLLCGKKIEKGIIYQEDNTLYEAEKYMQVHIEKEHGSVFEYLINLDKKITGLSEHQNKLLKLFYDGKSDTEVQSELGIGSSSTIRNHRFVLKEKERQAKVFLVLMELLKCQEKSPNAPAIKRNTAVMVNEPYKVSTDESEKIIKKCFPEGISGSLKTFALKEKGRWIVTRELSKRFEPGRIYNEKEVNEILKTAYQDFSTLRRYLIDYGFMDRKSDGSQYWLKSSPDKMEEGNMDRRKELKQQYKEMKTQGGVYQVRNMKNQKVLVVATPNLKTINGRLGGGYMNKEFQDEWNRFGREAFVFEILEVLEEKGDGFFDKKEELKKLEKKWLEKLQPYGECGYNKKKE